MRRCWVLGFTLYVAFFALTIGLRWREIAQPSTDFTWNTAHSQLIVDNWLENGFWNERGISFLNAWCELITDGYTEGAPRR